ncbi:MAG: hypothetical protein ACI9Y8_001321 [Candidatus Omnitrophota bacterium]|jgi:hypothetical protein
MQLAFKANPTRFKNKVPKLWTAPITAWINKPKDEANATPEEAVNAL